MLQIVTGDGGVPYLITLTKNDAQFEIPSTAIVKARVVSKHNNTPLTGVIDQPEGQVGADWATSLVAVSFPANETAGLVDHLGQAKLEVQVNDDGPLTWHVPVTIVKGTID